MRSAITFFLLLMLVCESSAQSDTSRVIYFNRAYMPEKEIDYVSYIGVPEKITNNIYQVTFYTMDGLKIAMGEYQHGNFRKRHGVFVLFDTVGKIVVSSTYKKGTLNGPYLRYFSNGRISDSGYVRRGNFSGKWMSWYDNGQPRVSCTYSRLLVRNGREMSFLDEEYKSWYPDGRLDDSGFYKNNQREGIWIDWLEEGRIRSVGLYKKNWKKGIWRYYDQQGKLLYMRRFSSFKYDKDGEFIPVSK